MNRIQDAIAAVSYRDWQFHLGDDNGRPYLQVKFHGKCVVTGKPGLQHGRKWYLSAHMTKSEVVATCFKAVMTAEEHEVREHFKFHDYAVFGPHLDVELLAALCAAGAYDVRRDRSEA